MKLILVRHAQTAANEEKRYCGATDLPLSPAGKETLRKRMRENAYPDMRGCQIITSGMLRCEQTLQILCADAAHTVNSAFREMNFGSFEMHTYEELKHNADYVAWIADDNEQKPAPGGESGAQMTARVIQALLPLMAQEKDTLLITHGGVIAAIMGYLFEAQHKNRYEWQSQPGGGYLIDTQAGTYRPF